MFRKGRKPSPVPESGPERFLRVKHRVNLQRSNGRFEDADRAREERLAAAEADLAAQVEADRRPIAEKVPEHEPIIDADGTYRGLKPKG